MSDALAVVNGVMNSVSVIDCIRMAEHPDPRRRRVIDFALLDRARDVAEQLVKQHGPTGVVPGTHGLTAAGIQSHVQGVLDMAEPHRPKAERK